VNTAAAIVVSGVVLGSLYALIAGGLSIIWSTLRVFNFAHGALLTLGAYVAWSAAKHLGWGALAIVVPTLAAMCVVGYAFERLFVRPFIRRPQGDLLVMVTTLAGAAIIVGIVQLIWGATPGQLPTVSTHSWRFLGTSIGANQLTAVILAPACLGGLALALRYTRVGLAIRAVEQNRDLARLVGIKPETVYVATILIAVSLATVAGILFGGIQFLTPAMGDDPLLKAFVVCVFGGLASLGGTVAGAYVVGMVEALATYYAGLFWTPVIIFSVMVVVMLVRPEGLVAIRTTHR
jgi:branched-chain amino acid transport system permease protein